MSRRLCACVGSALAVVGLVGCGDLRPDQNAHAHGSADWEQIAQEHIEYLAQVDGQLIEFDVPKDIAPPIYNEYRFALGDTMKIGMYGFPSYWRNNIIVTADGTISYLDQTGIPAAGLSVAELREEIAKRMVSLVKYPVVMIKPDEVAGHRYVLLGKIIDKGSFPIDQPLRILDVMARARGIETGLQGGSTVEVANFDQSFLVRENEFVPIDFQSMLQEGDLRYNIYVHPGDIFYFPSTVNTEIYIMGKVSEPGSHPYNNGMTLTAALASREGFDDDAFLMKFLSYVATLPDQKSTS